MPASAPDPGDCRRRRRTGLVFRIVLWLFYPMWWASSRGRDGLDWIEVPFLMLLGFAILHVQILVHESGHLISGWLVGIRSHLLVVGDGPRLANVRIGGLTCRWHLFPSYGFVQPEGTACFYRFGPQAFFFAGGVMAEAITAGVLWWLRQDVSSLPPWERHALIYAWFLGFLHSVGSIIDNLVPREVLIENRLTPNDGLLLQKLWRGRAGLPRQRQMLQDMQDCEQLIATETYTVAAEKLTVMADTYPDNVWVWFARGQLSAFDHDTDAALAHMERALELAPDPDDLQARILDQLICMILFAGRIDRLSDADRWSEEAVRKHPDRITLQGTRGAVLIELGQLAEGGALLQHVLTHSKDPLDLAISEAYLALAAARGGRRDEAAASLERARLHRSDVPAIDLIAERIASLTAPDTSPLPPPPNLSSNGGPHHDRLS